MSPCDILIPLAVIFRASIADPDIPIPVKLLPSPKYELAVIVPLAVMDVKVWLAKSKLSISKFAPYMVPLELIFPVVITFLAYKALQKTAPY